MVLEIPKSKTFSKQFKADDAIKHIHFGPITADRKAEREFRECNANKNESGCQVIAVGQFGFPNSIRVDSAQFD